MEGVRLTGGGDEGSRVGGGGGDGDGDGDGDDDGGADDIDGRDGDGGRRGRGGGLLVGFLYVYGQHKCVNWRRKRKNNKRRTCLDMIIFAMETGTSD